MSTRCLALGNPCCIEKGSNWLGLSPVQPDRRFCCFVSMAYGLRAFFKLMNTYRRKYRCITIKEIISKYAPIQENNTFGYISNVVRFMNKLTKIDYPDSNFVIDENTVVNSWFSDKEPKYWLRLFARAVMLQENSYDCPDEIMNDAIRLL